MKGKERFGKWSRGERDCWQKSKVCNRSFKCWNVCYGGKEKLLWSWKAFKRRDKVSGDWLRRERECFRAVRSLEDIL